MATTLEVLNASQIAMLLNPPMVNLGTSTFSSPDSGGGSTYVVIPFTTQLSKSGNITWSSGTNPSRVTAVVPGTYMVSGSIIWPGALGSADGRAQVEVNGAAQNVRFNTIRGSAGNSTSVCSGLQVLHAGDFLEFGVNQNSGGAITLIVTMGLNLVSLATS